MAGNVIKRNNIHPIVRVVLVSILILCGGSLVVSIYWIFQKINHSAGVELAEVAVAFLSILVLALILVGMRAGLGLDRWIRYRRFEECRLFHSSKHTHRALSWLGYGHLALEGEAASEELDGWNVEELLALFEKPKRGGRRPTHPPERWIRVVLAWENRDLVRNTLTLPEFLCQEFGTNADGTPRESESNFYDYRKKILKQIKKKAGRK
ncbi:MAG TPA: hypothetical protein PKC99_00670 [Anaerolineales bacterium]|nr:hypothetical protein [Anaerolineales bacterium]